MCAFYLHIDDVIFTRPLCRYIKNNLNTSLKDNKIVTSETMHTMLEEALQQTSPQKHVHTTTTATTPNDHATQETQEQQQEPQQPIQMKAQQILQALKKQKLQ